MTIPLLRKKIYFKEISPNYETYNANLIKTVDLNFNLLSKLKYEGKGKQAIFENKDGQLDKETINRWTTKWTNGQRSKTHTQAYSSRTRLQLWTGNEVVVVVVVVAAVVDGVTRDFLTFLLNFFSFFQLKSFFMKSEVSVITTSKLQQKGEKI